MNFHASLRWRSALGLILRFYCLLALALTSGDPAETCDGTSAMDAELEPTLYLLQKHAHVIRKTQASSSVDVREAAAHVSSLAVMRNKSNEAHALGILGKNSSASGLKCDTHSELHMGRTRSLPAVFIASASSRIVPITHEQRLSMLSTSEVSGFSEKSLSILRGALIALLVLVCGMIIGLDKMESSCTKLIRELITLGLGLIANHILGADVSFSSVDIRMFKGIVKITNLTVANPPNWRSEYFMNANMVVVELNLCRLFWAHVFGQDVDVGLASLQFKDVSLHVEKSSDSSNIQDIKAVVKGIKPQLARSVEKLPTLERDYEKTHDQALSTVHRILIADMIATVPYLGNFTMPIVNSSDCAKEIDMKAETMRPIVAEIIGDVCDRVASFPC